MYPEVHFRRPLLRGLKAATPISHEMHRTLIGAGGWGYFSGGLPAYARAFSFVEVNATFYRHVSESSARRWRVSVPEAFVFAVKAHQDVTHRSRLRPTPSARAAFAQTARIARILHAPFLVLETPASRPIGRDEVSALREFAAMTEDGMRLALEARAYDKGPLPVPLRRAMEDLGILDVVDLSKVAPRVAADSVYTRLFGKGEQNVYEFDDAELREIDRAGKDATTVAFAFHGVRMYKDAARFLTFRRTGVFPPVTDHVGLASLEEVLAPDARFPADRNDLVRDHGWKVIDVSADRRAHADTLLSRLPSGRYQDLDSVLRALGSLVRGAEG